MKLKFREWLAIQENTVSQQYKHIPPDVIEQNKRSLQHFLGTEIDNDPNLKSFSKWYNHLNHTTGKHIFNNLTAYDPNSQNNTPIDNESLISFIKHPNNKSKWNNPGYTHEMFQTDLNNYIFNAPDPGQTWITLPGGFRWTFIDRSSCARERAAGAHCGNMSGAEFGDRLLSLRQRTGKNKEAVRATVVLDKNNFISKRKGWGNKPIPPELYPQMVALLKDNRIRGLVSNNPAWNGDFSIKNLPPELKTDLQQNRPDYFGGTPPKDVITDPYPELIRQKHAQLAKNLETERQQKFQTVKSKPSYTAADFYDPYGSDDLD